MISTFKNIKSVIPTSQIDVYDFFDQIKSPSNQIKEQIAKARNLYDLGNIDEYNRIKENLPCFTLNFSFGGGRKKENIISPTGFIYIDLDGTTDINFDNPFIFASWKSLSNNGRGILVKVNGLKPDNFSDTYRLISEYLNIESDSGAKKSTQPNVHSWDEDIYINNDSSIWLIDDVIDNTPNLLTYKKEKEGTQELGVIRYDNIDEIDFKGEEYLEFLEEKYPTARLIIPSQIVVGKRNNTLSAMALQCRALNPKISKSRFLGYIKAINSSRCNPPLNTEEVESICNRTLAVKNIKPLLNSPRRIIFNPQSDLDLKERRMITNRAIGKSKRIKTQKELQKNVDNWDYQQYGRVTQKKLALVSGRNIKTIEKYYKYLKIKR